MEGGPRERERERDSKCVCKHNLLVSGDVVENSDDMLALLLLTPT